MLSQVKLSQVKGGDSTRWLRALNFGEKNAYRGQKRGNKARQQAIPLRRFIDQSAEAI
jgi:hypothetical protein